MKFVRLLALVLLFFAPVGAQSLEEIEQQVLAQTNLVRSQSGLKALTMDPLLAEIARGHSEEMLVQEYFSHDSPNQLCRTVSDRLRYGHRFCLSSAENLHKCQGFAAKAVANSAVNSWLDSPHHRRNILHSRFNRVGIGVARKGKTYMFTQLFSYESLIVQGLDVTPNGSGYEVKIHAQVVDGPREGGWFINGKRQSDWVTDSQGEITTVLLFNGPGSLEIGQLVGTREWEVETQIPIPPPEFHLRHATP